MNREINRETESHRSEIPREVTSFLSAFQDKDPMLYPGERPEQSYVTDGQMVYSLEVNDTKELSFLLRDVNGKQEDLNDFLREHDAPPLEDRIPVLGFGANMSPGSLAAKFTKVGREDAFCVPTAYTTLKDHDVVWSGGPGMNGNFIATLYNGPEVQDTEVQVGVNFLTREQLLVMNATEMAYQLAWVDVSIAGHPIRAYYYVGQDQIYLKDSMPVAIESVPAKGRSISQSNTKSILEDVIKDKAIIDRVAEDFPAMSHVETVDDYLALVAQLKAEKRSLALKKAMHRAIAEYKSVRKVEADNFIHRMESWANPSTLPTLGDQELGFFHHPIYRLPSQELGKWRDSTARERLLKSITTHLVRHSGGHLK